jgi:metal iron transporter
VDLQAGSEYGYRLLFIVLLAGLFAVLLQVRRLSYPLNQVFKRSIRPRPLQASSDASPEQVKDLNTEHPDSPRTTLILDILLDLASHCRLLFYNRPKHTLLYRWLVLYPLYVLSEIAIISTDLAELLGSAMGLVMLFPKLPLWAGVIITACDVFVILLVGDPLRRQPVKLFEWLIAAMVCTCSTSFITFVPTSNGAHESFK